MQNIFYDTIIIGGGITGISALHYLNKFKQNKNANFLLIEKESKLGGNVRSYNYHGTTFDYGSLEIFDYYYAFHDFIKQYDIEYYEVELKKVVNKKSKSFFDFMTLFKQMLHFGYQSYYNVADSKNCSQNACSTFPQNSYYNDFIYSYTYGDCTKLLNCISYAIIPVHLRSPSSEKLVKGSLQKVLENITQKLTKDSHNNNQLLLNTEVFDIKKLTNNKIEVITNQGSFICNNVIVTSPFNSPIHSKLLNIKFDEKNNDYTHYYVVIVEVTQTKKNWNVYLENIPKTNKELHITTYGYLPDISPNILLIYIRSKTSIRLTDNIIKTFIIQNAKFINSNEDQVLLIDFFPQTMPNITKDILALLKANKNIYFAGQYLGFPTLETSVFSAYKAAQQISIKNYGSHSKYFELEDHIKHEEQKTKQYFYFIIASVFIVFVLIIMLILSLIGLFIYLCYFITIKNRLF